MASSVWSEASFPWRRCLELAWESFCVGSVPVGSVLTDSDGSIVSEGRNRAFDATAASVGLAGTFIAHAEVNALAPLPPGDYPDHVLWSSLEPCFMCTAAVLHSHVGTVRFAASDPLMVGVAELPKINRWVNGRWPDRSGPLSGPLADFASLVPLTWNLTRQPDGEVARAYARAQPELLRRARSLAGDGTLERLREASVEDALEVVCL